uniref:Atos homolog protein B n=1 Tax=Varanus komodoensis TaxID=61221 RepID=A0A8D2Q7K3_VARKO
MRHINAEAAPPRERGVGTSRRQQPGDEEEDEEEEEPRPWPRGFLLGCGPPALAPQKVYQVSIFSPAPGRQPIKRACPGPLRPAEGPRDAKRRPWEDEGDDAIEDGLLGDELSLGGAAQHFSHSGLRVVEHRPEGGPGPPRAPGGAAQLPRPPHSTLHRRDCGPAPPGACPTDSGPAERRGENGASQATGHGGHRPLADPDLHSLAPPSPPGGGPPVTSGPVEPGTPPAAHASDTNGLASAEKTPPGPLLAGSSAVGGCPAKRKLLPSTEGSPDPGYEDESLPPARKKRSLPCPAVPASCRSTDAKGAPFWNHLLPAAKVRRRARCPPRGRGWGHRRAGAAPQGGRAGRSGSRVPRGGPGDPLCSRPLHAPWATTSTSRALLGNFEESMLPRRPPEPGRIEGFTAEIGASGSYCPQHVTLPVEVTYFDIAEHSAPSPFLGVVDLEALGKKGYSVPKTGTIQVVSGRRRSRETLFNPNKTVVKMFLVTYDFHDMPANHVTFLRHRIFLVPVGEEPGPGPAPGEPPRRVLCYLLHLRFHSSKSGKIYLHDNIRLLFSRKSIEIDSGIPYELKSFTELPRNPCYSPRA